MKRVALETNSMTVAELVQMAQKEPVIVTRRGKPFVSVKSLKGQDWECVSLANNPEFRAIIEESRRSYEEHGGIPLEQAARELGLRIPSQRTSARGKKKRAKSHTHAARRR